MRRLQIKITCWMAAGFFGLAFMILLAHTAHSVHWIMRYQKRTLQPIAESIEAEAKSAGMSSAEPLSAAEAAILTEKLRFASGSRSIGCAITDTDGDVLFRTSTFAVPLRKRHFASTKERKIFCLSVKSGEKSIDDMLSNWHFLYRQHSGDFLIFLDNRQNYESVERFAEGVGVALLLAFVLAVPSGYFYGRRILHPIRSVRATLTEIRQGRLDARIGEDGLSEEIQHLVRDLNKTFGELQDSFSRIAEFSAAAAHELKTPLTVMRGNLEVCLAQDRPAEEYRDTLGDMLGETVTLSRIVDQLLLLASPERAPTDPNLTIFALAEVARSIVQICQSAAEEKEIELTAELDEDASIQGNAELIARLLHNLVHNAVKFSPAGSRVDIEVRSLGDRATVEVRDQGPGISEKHRRRIFDRFYQVDPSRHSGTGLGLAIAKWIVEYHSGHISVESQDRGGSAFRVTLPVRQREGARSRAPSAACVSATRPSRPSSG